MSEGGNARTPRTPVLTVVLTITFLHFCNKIWTQKRLQGFRCVKCTSLRLTRVAFRFKMLRVRSFQWCLNVGYYRTIVSFFALVTQSLLFYLIRRWCGTQEFLNTQICNCTKKTPLNIWKTGLGTYLCFFKSVVFSELYFQSVENDVQTQEEFSLHAKAVPRSVSTHLISSYCTESVHFASSCRVLWWPKCKEP